MALTWEDAEDIAAELVEAHPDVDPLTVRFTDLRKWVIALPDGRDRGARAGAPAVPREDRPGADPQGAGALPPRAARRLRPRPSGRADDLPRRDRGGGGAHLAQRVYERACGLLAAWHLRYGAGMARGAAPCHGSLRKDDDRRREATGDIARHHGRAECARGAGV